MSTGSTMRRCIFCGRSDTLTGDHVISRAVRRELRIKSNVVRHYGDQTREMGDALSVIVKPVCVGCNGGWMSRLERDVVSFFGVAFRAAATVDLDPSRQERLATWAIKTALLLEVYTVRLPYPDRRAYVPEGCLRWLAGHSSPPPGAKVWLGFIDCGGQHFVWHHAGSVRSSVGQDVAFLTTFSVGYALFQVYAEDVWDKLDRLSINPPPRYLGARRQYLARPAPRFPVATADEDPLGGSGGNREVAA
jgi:hypothetical protein